MRDLVDRVRGERGEEGAVAVLTAALLLALMVAASLAVDVGKVAYGSRDQQGATDRVALDSVLLLAEAADAEVVTASQVADFAAVRLEDNPGFANEQRRVVRITLGRWVDGRFERGTGTAAVWQVSDFPAEGRYPGGPPASTCSDADPIGDGVPFDAVCVDTESFVPFTFTIGSDVGGRWIVRSAVAATAEPIAAIAAGTTLASLSEGAGERLLALLGGGEVDLRLVGYEGAVQARVDLPQLAAALGAGTVDELLDTTVSLPELLDAAATALTADDDAPTAAAQAQGLLAHLAATFEVVEPIRIGDVLHLDPGPGAGLAGQVDLASFLTASLLAANQQHGIELDGEVAGQPVRLEVVEPPQVAVGPVGATVARTAQLRLAADVDLLALGGDGPDGTDAQGAVAAAVEEIVAPFRDRIDALGSCGEAVGPAGQAIRDDLDEAVRAARGWADDERLLALVSERVGATQAQLDGLLSAVTDTLGCALDPGGTLASIRHDLHEAADGYRDVLRILSGGEETPGSVSAKLAVELAAAEARLTAISCDADPRSLAMDVDVHAGRVASTTATLARLDLGILGTVTLQLGGELALGSSRSEVDQHFTVPETRTYTVTTVGAPDPRQLLGTPWVVDPGPVGEVDLGPVVGPVRDAALSVLGEAAAVFDDQLDGLVELGLHVGDADVTGSWVGRCGGRRLVR
jgi:uncharacterized membrane protein